MEKVIKITAALSFLLFSVFVFADDVPAPVQGVGEHSTISCIGGHIRDDELAKWICDSIPKKPDGTCKVHDVKIMVNSCFGGGILDDIQDAFGAGGCCPGVPWVAGSASVAEKPAYGWPDKYVKHPVNNGKDLGSNWTDALAGKAQSHTRSEKGVLRNDSTGNVKQDLEKARDRDDSGPNHDNVESPVIASGNGGENIGWNEPGVKHKAVVAGGHQTDQRHHNNIKNMREALEEVWGDGWLWEYFFGKDYDITTLDGFNKDTLKNAIEKACEDLDEDTQLVIYIDDHGDTDFDISEWLSWYYETYFPSDSNLVFPVTDPCNPVYVDSETSQINFTLHSGWTEAFTLVSAQPGDEPQPFLEICPAGMLDDAEWDITLNGYPLEFPEPELPEDRIIPLYVPWEIIFSDPDENTLIIERLDPSAGDMELRCLNISSGPINEIWADHDPLCGDEYHPQPIGDLSGDCKVDMVDFAIMVESWLVDTYNVETME